MANHAIKYHWDGNKKHPAGEYTIAELSSIRKATKQTIHDRIKRHGVEWAMDRIAPGSAPLPKCLCGCDTRLKNSAAKFVDTKHRRKYYKGLMKAGKLDPSGHNTCHCGRKFPWYKEVGNTKIRKTCSIACQKKINGTNSANLNVETKGYPFDPYSRVDKCVKDSRQCIDYDMCWDKLEKSPACKGCRISSVNRSNNCGNQGVAVSRGLGGFGVIRGL
jgi:hypothetical protein